MPKSPEKIRKHLRFLFALALTVGVLWLLLHQVDSRRIAGLIRGISLSAWLKATVLTMTFPVLMALRWQILLKQLGFSVSGKACLLIILGVWPVSTVTPAKVGDLLRAASLRNQFEPFAVMGSVLAERYLDLLVLGTFAFCGALWLAKLEMILVSAVFLGGLGSLMFLAGKRPGFPLAASGHQRRENLLWSLRCLRQERRSTLWAVALTTLKWLAVFLLIKVLLEAVSARVPFGMIVMAMPVSILVGLLPLTISGMGLREGAMMALFASVATGSQILTVGLLYSFFAYWLMAIVGLPFLGKALVLDK